MIPPTLKFVRMPMHVLREFHAFLVEKKNAPHLAAEVDELICNAEGWSDWNVGGSFQLEVQTLRSRFPLHRLEPIEGLQLRWFNFTFRRIFIEDPHRVLERGKIDDTDLAPVLHVDFEILDRDTAQPFELTFRKPLIEVKYGQRMDMVTANSAPSHLAQLIRTGLHEAITHEVDECLRWQGGRVWDPH